MHKCTNSIFRGGVQYMNGGKLRNNTKRQKAERLILFDTVRNTGIYRVFIIYLMLCDHDIAYQAYHNI